MAENFQSGRQCFATVQAQSENYLISTGSWDNSFQVISLQDGRTVQSVRQHKDVVSCVSGALYSSTKSAEIIFFLIFKLTSFQYHPMGVSSPPGATIQRSCCGKFPREERTRGELGPNRRNPLEGTKSSTRAHFISSAVTMTSSLAYLSAPSSTSSSAAPTMPLASFTR